MPPGTKSAEEEVHSTHESPSMARKPWASANMQQGFAEELFGFERAQWAAGVPECFPPPRRHACRPR